MKKASVLIALIAFLLCGSFSHAKPIDKAKVLKAAKTFLVVRYPASDQNSIRTITLRGRSALRAKDVLPLTVSDKLVGYVADLEPAGFVVFSADDETPPVKVYSDKGSFENLPPGLKRVLELELLEDNTAVNAKEKQHLMHKAQKFCGQWTFLTSEDNQPDTEDFSTDAANTAILTTTWNQDDPYNFYAPTATGGPGGRAWAGCTATALAQILRHHSFPSSVTSNHTYTDNLGTCQGAHSISDAGIGAYDWVNMPASISTSSPNAQKQAVGQLIYHCGVALESNYEAGGTGAYPTSVPSVLWTYFNYTLSDYLQKSNYTDAQWYDKIRSDIDNDKPVFYAMWEAGWDNGHAVVCDGYRNGNEMHLDLGWSGTGTAWYNLDSVSSGGYTWTIHGAVFGITPTNNQPPVPPDWIIYPTSSDTGQYTVSWLSSGAESYQLERSSNGGGSWSQIYSGPSTSRPESVGNGNYRYRVKATIGQVSSGYRTGTSDCVVNIPSPQGPPQPAFINYPSSSDTGFYTVNWGSSSGADHYEVHRICNEIGCLWGQVYYGTNTSFQEDTGSGVFRYRVRAITAGVPSNWTNGDHECMVPPLPATPSFIIYPSDSNTGQYVISWEPSTWAKSYQLEMSYDGGVGWRQIYSGENTSYSENVGNGNYRYRVKATNFKGESGYKSGTWDCVVDIPPTPPTPSPNSIGSLFVWGMNDYGQCDNIPAGNNFIAINAGWYHSLALKSDGSIVGWGDNSYGKATPPAGNNFVAVAAGENFSLALKSDGSIVAWGSNAYGQLNIPAPNSNFVAIAAGWIHSVALKADGSLVAWGNNDYGKCTCPPGSGFRAVAAGYNHSLALKSNGSLVAWGKNDYGQLNIPAPNSNFKAIAAGWTHNVAVKLDGSIVAWGDNRYSQCTGVPTGNNFKTVAGGEYHSLALKSDGSVVAWGSNAGACSFCSPNGNNFKAVAVGAYHNVTISIAGDFNGDRVENFADFAVFARAWMSQPGQADWNAACDISVPKDNIINWSDLCVFAGDWLGYAGL